MDIIDISKKAIVLDSKEVERLRNILFYVRHRINVHGKTQAGDLAYIKYFLERLEELK